MLAKMKQVSCPAPGSQRNFRLGHIWFLSIEEVWDGPCHRDWGRTSISPSDVPAHRAGGSSSLLHCSWLMGRRTWWMGSYLNCQFIWLKSALLPLWSAAADESVSLRSKVQKFWFSRSYYCQVRSLENHGLQKQTGLTLTTDVLP